MQLNIFKTNKNYIFCLQMSNRCLIPMSFSFKHSRSYNKFSSNDFHNFSKNLGTMNYVMRRYTFKIIVIFVAKQMQVFYVKCVMHPIPSISLPPNIKRSTSFRHGNHTFKWNQNKKNEKNGSFLPFWYFSRNFHAFNFQNLKYLSEAD